MPNGVSNGNGLTRSLKVIATVLSILVVVVGFATALGMTRQQVSQNKQDIATIRSDERDHYHLTSEQWDALEGKLDDIRSQVVALNTQVEHLTTEINRLRD